MNDHIHPRLPPGKRRRAKEGVVLPSGCFENIPSARKGKRGSLYTQQTFHKASFYHAVRGMRDEVTTATRIRPTQCRAPNQARSLFGEEMRFLDKLLRGGCPLCSLPLCTMLMIALKGRLRPSRHQQPLGKDYRSEHLTRDHFDLRLKLRPGPRRLAVEGE